MTGGHTPDFEDWLSRQEVKEEDLVSIEAFRKMAIEKWGLKGASLDVAEGMYYERWKGLEAYGIRPVEREYLYQGEPFEETRYAIKGERGLFGKWRAYEIAAERAEAAGDYDSLDLFRFRLEEMVLEPEWRRSIHQVPREE
jgi:hypothetical protein